MVFEVGYEQAPHLQDVSHPTLPSQIDSEGGNDGPTSRFQIGPGSQWILLVQGDRMDRVSRSYMSEKVKH